MKRNVEVRCLNNGKEYKFAPGTSLEACAAKACPVARDKKGREYPVFAAIVDHKLKELSYEMFYSHEVEFIGYNHPDGRRTYFRSLSFLLQHAVRKLFPRLILVIDHALPSGYYCELLENRKDEDGRTVVYPVSLAEIDALQVKMRETVAADLPFVKTKMLAEEAEALFDGGLQYYKSRLTKSLGRYFCSVYYLDGIPDSFHGPLVPSTGYLDVFRLLPFGRGFCLQYPDSEDITRVIPTRPQVKLAEMFRRYSDWCFTTRIIGVSSLNQRLLSGGAVELINLCEARHERDYAEIADRIYAARDHVKIVFIAGPSSSGKTSSSLRLAQQCKVLGLNPKVIELDNYFVERDETPRDEDGDFDFEALEAMDLRLLGEQLNRLLAGEEVEIPRYDFKQGRKFFEGNMLRLEERDILIMEGIHALDPAMVPSVDQNRIFRVYASALTSLNVDENNCISTSDNRLLRRMVRDNRVRGISPEATLLRWASVRRGENRNIFPFQENADALFNSALLYELPMLKYYAEPLLRRILPSSPAYPEAVRLLKFLDYIVALQPAEIDCIPPTSIMREFIGGQTL